LPTLERVARHAIRDTTTTFETLQFFEHRQNIQTAIEKEVNKRISELCFASVPLLNILTIDVPDKFEQSVIQVRNTNGQTNLISYMYVVIIDH
jgi:hypothetical protein